MSLRRRYITIYLVSFLSQFLFVIYECFFYIYSFFAYIDVFTDSRPYYKRM